jgi:serine protease Do
VAQLERTGHVTRGYLGVEAQQLSQSMAKALKLPDEGGALVAGVNPDSPAAKAGLQPGDVVEAVNGQRVRNPRELAVTVASIKPGEPAKLDVVREGQHETLTAQVAEMPGESQVADSGAAGEHEGRARLGVALAPVSPDMRDQLDLPSSVKGGAVVARVQPGSPADQAGIQPGDVIVGVGGKQVASPEDAVRAIRSAREEALALRIIRNGQPAFVAVDLGKSAAQGDSQG